MRLDFKRVSRSVFRRSYYVAVSLILIIMFFTTADVIGRYLLNKPVTGTLEICQLTLVGMIMLGIAHTQVEGGHVRIMLFLRRLSPRAKAITGIIHSTLAAGIFGIVAWQGMLAAIIDFNRQLTSDLLRWLPIWPFKLLVSIGAFFLAVELLIELVEFIRQSREMKRV